MRDGNDERCAQRAATPRQAFDAFPLEPTGRHSFRSHTDPRFWNQIGPFGGWLAGLAMAAMRSAAPAPWVPRSLSVQFLGAVPAGDVEVEWSVVRQQRRVTGLRVEMRGPQDRSPAVVADGVFGLPRPDEHAAGMPAPALPEVDRLPRYTGLDPLAAFVRAFDYRIASGEPFARGDAPRSSGWVRPVVPHELEPQWLLMLADAWFPPGWVSRADAVPVSTISMQIVFHDTRALCQEPEGFFRASFREESRADGFGLERGELWWPDGRLALTSQQLTWIGEGASWRRPSAGTMAEPPEGA